MLPISSKSLNGANSASRRATEVPKKGKSSEFNQKNYEQVKSRPSLTVWSHEGSNLYPKIAQQGKNRGAARDSKIFLKGKQKYFQTATDIISSEQLRKLKKIKPFGHSEASKKRKKGHILLIFPALGKMTHMGAKEICFAKMRKPVCEDQVGELKVKSVQLFQG